MEVFDTLGNLLDHVGGTGPRPLIQGHADEIGFVVRSIDDDGFLWLASGQAGRLQPLSWPFSPSNATSWHTCPSDC